MHFCDKCSNMYYIRISTEDQNKLIYYCKNCGHEDTIITNDNICVSKMQIKRGEQKYKHIVNKYTKLDPTLPRINTIKCPNAECPTNEGDEHREIIYIRYDDINIKYLYLCAKCDFTWRTSEQK